MPETPNITPESLLAILDDLKAEYGAVLDQLDLNIVPAPGEWNPRQVLSHIIGSLERTPVQAGYFLAASKDVVPVVFSDPYWISAWENAPIQSFKAVFDAAIEGNKGLVRSLTPDLLWRTATLYAFGEMPLAVFMMVNYKNHLKDQHLHQLRAFLGEAQPA